jgi:ubiquinone/menaquinone biosynthesis C-methylase UbiE
MINSNDPTAEFHDLVNATFKDKFTNAQELSLIKSLLPRHGKILDLACGTGRHLVSLIGEGYQVTGIDSSAGMLKVLNKKLSTIRLTNQPQIINDDFLKFNFKSTKFDLIIMMWNVFNEIALTKTQALILLQKCKRLLASSGKILINIDNRNKINLPFLDYQYTINENHYQYDVIWKVLKFNERTSTTVLQETITKSQQNKKIKSAQDQIIQRWWSKDEITALANKVNFLVHNKILEANEELYLILHNNLEAK